MSLPKILATSIVRTSQAGEAHGFIYLVDLESSEIIKTVKWDEPNINFEGRGGDRGLRGIEFYNEKVFIASGTRLLEFDKDLNLINSYANDYLLDCHEIAIYDKILYVVSSGFDSILEFDLTKSSFTKGYMVRNKTLEKPPRNRLFNILRNRWSQFNIYFHIFKKPDYLFEIYNPREKGGPTQKDTIHINMVSANENGIYLAGTRMIHLMEIKNDKLTRFATTPKNTHNTQRYSKSEVISNYTQIDKLTIHNRKGVIIDSFSIPFYNESELEHKTENASYARQGFARGLAFHEDYLITGHSPATISIFKRGSKNLVKKVTLSRDVRNALHGLEIFPF